MGKNNSSSLVISYLALRQAIGYLGVFFPFILAFGAYGLNHEGIQSSISSYYYTKFTGDIFVGVLFVIGFILFAYKGHESRDNIAGNIACLCALCVALFPTPPVNPPPNLNPLIGYIHYGAATIFFLTLIYFCLVLFVNRVPNPTKQKLMRNNIYRICGYTMLGCISAIVAHAVISRIFADGESLMPNFLFWTESIAIIAFGFSWLVKGEALLKDVK